MCPQLTFYSFAVIFALILVVVFGLQLGIDGIDRDRSENARFRSEFLPIELQGKFTDFMSNRGDKVKANYQLYRPLTSLFVHISAQHLVSNAIMLIIWASYFEIFLSTYKTPVIFGLSG